LKKNQGWKEEVFFDHIDNPEAIGRATAVQHGVAWATVWDFKQKMIKGEVNTKTFLTKPKILMFDIETAPLLVHNWSLWQNYTSLNQVMGDWFMLSWAAKWYGEDEVFSDSLVEHRREFKADPQNDKVIIQSLYKLIDEADVIIGHNVKKFDDKKSKARFLKHGLTMPSSYRKIDTLDIAKREFALASNKLDWLATYLGHPNKVAHEGHSLWVKCMDGDADAWAVMMEYNIHDVVLLEDVYNSIRGWSSNHINLAVYYNDFIPRCPVCGGTDLTETGALSATNQGRFADVKCGDCGKVSKLKTNLMGKRKRDTLLGNIV
jgi:hypothetical protein